MKPYIIFPGFWHTIFGTVIFLLSTNQKNNFTFQMAKVAIYYQI